MLEKKQDKILTLHPFCSSKQFYTYKFDDEEPKTIGRLSTSFISLKDPSISKNHAEIKYNQIEKQFIIQDQSKNGTFLQIKDKILEQQDIIRVGPSEFMIKVLKIVNNESELSIRIELINSEEETIQDNTISFNKEDILQKKEITIGRLDDRDIKIQSNEVSRKHSQIVLKLNEINKKYDFQYVNSSEQGSWLRLKKGQEYVIHDEQSFIFGKQIFKSKINLFNQQMGEQKELNVCSVCLDQEINTYAINCGHAALCKQCCLDLMNNNKPCPLCRSPIIDFGILYHD